MRIERTLLSTDDTEKEIALLEEMTDFIERHVSVHRFVIFQALEEVLANAKRYGQTQKMVMTGEVETISPKEKVIAVRVPDRGPLYDPASVPDPTLDENLELTHGRGHFFMRRFGNVSVEELFGEWTKQVVLKRVELLSTGE